MDFIPVIINVKTTCPYCEASEMLEVKIYESILNGEQTWGGNCSECGCAYCVMSMPDLK